MKGNMPRIKPLFILIAIGIAVLIIIGIFPILDFFTPEQIDTSKLEANLDSGIESLQIEIAAIKNSVDEIRSSGASRQDIQNLDNKISRLENQIANIEPQAIQNIDLTNISNYVNNYNIRLIFDFTVALTLIHIIIFPIGRWVKRKVVDIFSKPPQNEYPSSQ